MILVAGTTLGGFGFLGALLPIAYAVQVVPSIRSAYRTWAPSGIAITTWLLILVECLLWGAMGRCTQIRRWSHLKWWAPGPRRQSSCG